MVHARWYLIRYHMSQDGGMDRDEQAVATRIRLAHELSDLSLRQFARALGTSHARLSAYCTGATMPSAAFLLRAERIAEALRRAGAAGALTPAMAAKQIMDYADHAPETAYAMALDARDLLRNYLQFDPGLADAWEAHPPAISEQWDTLLAALVAHEFVDAGLPEPRWARGRRLETEWVMVAPRLDRETTQRQTPDWLADRNIFIAAKDLVTL